MKKFISMVMAAAMVVTLVPATAFAANTATFKVVKNLEVTAAEAVAVTNDGDVSEMATAQNALNVPQLQIKLSDVDSVVGKGDSYEFKLSFDGINVAQADYGTNNNYSDVKVYRGTADAAQAITGFTVKTTVNEDKDTLTVNVTETTTDLKAGDIISVNLDGVMKKVKEGAKATVKVTGDFGASEEMTFAEIVAKAIKVELDDDVVKVAPEESNTIETLVIKPAAGYDWNDVLTFNYVEDANGDFEAVKTGGTHAKVVLKASKGFEFLNGAGNAVSIKTDNKVNAMSNVFYTDDEITFYVQESGRGVATEITVEGIDMEATTAKAGATGSIKVTTSKLDSVSVEVIEVVDMAVVMELVDPDEDVPTFYNGVDVDNTGLTVEDDHISLEVKIYETFKGAWSNHKNFTLSLPEGVFVVADGVDAEDVNETFTSDENGDVNTGAAADTALEALFEEAYERGDHEVFDFKKYSYNETHDEDDAEKAHELTFTLQLIAEPDFVGDVVLKLEGAALETQEVTIAKVLAPYTVKAEQNDVIIDYRYTEVPTDIVITEAEAGLWAEGLTVGFEVERGDMIQFEDDATISVNEESGMEIDDDVTVRTVTTINGETVTTYTDYMGFYVDEESDEEAAVITISDIELFMQRNIPAGPYALEVGFNSATAAYSVVNLLGQPGCDHSDCVDVDDVDDYSTTVHEAWVNVVTAGRDQDDASFTTKIVVPVGETTMYAGEKAITLDVPAYINANDYVMLPVRAVATALGIDNNAVQWDQATKTVIIMYGQRIITMTAGQSVVYVSGTAIPAKAAVEIVDGRAFLGLRDLATTLGISNINYDATTKTATLN